MSFDGLQSLVERLRVIGERLPDSPAPRRGLDSEIDDNTANGDDFRENPRGGQPGAFGPMSFVPGEINGHVWQQRQIEVLLRVDENLRRLRELVETRATAAAVLFADPA